MKFNTLMYQLYGAFLFVLGVLGLYFITPSVFFNEAFWGNARPDLVVACLIAITFIFFELYSFWLGYCLIRAKYPRKLFLWIALPYILLISFIGIMVYFLKDVEL